QDEFFSPIYEALKSNQPVPKEMQHYTTHYRLQNDVLYFLPTVAQDASEWRLCVPNGPQRQEFIKHAHDPPLSGHFGPYRTYINISSNYYWPKMFRT
ncbi:hypothetical protein V1514DRAFT_266586, partial [Lipomyces japonicus]|uniref:uncharacterized protein n=1 Tax=Lipomyces japonicus TaxID=56871 RepID=UPI0034CDA74A